MVWAAGGPRLIEGREGGFFGHGTTNGRRGRVGVVVLAGRQKRHNCTSGWPRGKPFRVVNAQFR